MISILRLLPAIFFCAAFFCEVNALIQSRQFLVSKMSPPLLNLHTGLLQHSSVNRLRRERLLMSATAQPALVSNNENVNKDGKKRESRGFLTSLEKFVKSNWLIVGEVIVIFLAKKYPHFAATGGPLKPEFWISKVAVMTIFFINGIAISISGSPEELKSAAKTNVAIQLFNFGFLPLLAKALVPFYPIPAFRDGLLVLSCLPTTINICVAQTLAAGASLPTAIFNAILGNVVGVFLTPLLAVSLLGAGKGLSLWSTLRKLAGVVITPLVLGQLARRTPLGPLAQRVTAYSRTLSSCLLLAIVYNVFSDTFAQGVGVKGAQLLGLGGTMVCLFISLTSLFWAISRVILPGIDTKTRAAALFVAPQKTLAFGIPFIKTALGSRPDIAYILAPLLLYAPVQLLLGSLIFVPAMKKEIEKADSFGEGGGI